MDQKIKTPPNETEIGNSVFHTAKALNLTANTAQTENATLSQHDVHYYKLTVPQGDNGLLRINLSDQNRQLDMTLYNSFRTAIGDGVNTDNGNKEITLYRGGDEENDSHYHVEEFFVKVFGATDDGHSYALEVFFGHDDQ